LHWTWDEDKSQANRRKHGLGFDTAKLVFEDPLAAHRPYPNTDEERWHTIGMVGNVVVMVAHTWPRGAYEEGDF